MVNAENNVIDLINNKNEKKYTVVSLFAGAGGLDLGFKHKGFKLIWANDIDKDACETHRSWSTAKVIQGDISKIDFSLIPDCDVITGGFPCQGFSLAGPRQIDDKRNVLYRYYVKLVEEKQPLAFVAENVKGILTLGDGTIIDAIIEDFSDKGYDVYPTLVNAAHYSVPQDRWRVIMIGFRKDLNVTEFKFPDPFRVKVALKEALKGMHEPNPNDVCHAAFSSRYMSRNRKRKWDEMGYTVPAMSKQVTLHPSSPDMIKLGEDLWKFGDNGITRRLSWKEAAVVQTFPKNIHFSGNLTSKYKQIGNAVPVKLAEVVAQELKRILNERLNALDLNQEAGV